MFIKEIFSKKKNVTIEMLHKKAFVEKMYEKSYIRGLLANSDRVHILDNNSLFSNTKKKTQFKPNLKINGSRSYSYSHKKKIKIYHYRKKPKVRREYKGCSSYSTTFLYKNRKNNFLRFQLPLCTVSKSKNFLDLFLKGFTKISKTKTVKGESSLILLASNKGGFICYSSGFRGFLPRRQFKLILAEWIKQFTCVRENVELQFLRNFIKLQKLQFTISSPSRFSFVLKSVINTMKLRRKRFLLSRKKRSYRCTTIAMNIVFYSTKNTSSSKKVGKNLVESSSTKLSKPLLKKRRIRKLDQENTAIL